MTQRTNLQTMLLTKSKVAHLFCSIPFSYTELQQKTSMIILVNGSQQKDLPQGLILSFIFACLR